MPESVTDAIRGLVDREPVITTYGALAERVDVAEGMVRRAVASLKSSGGLRVLPAGRQGVRLTVAASEPAPARRVRKAVTSAESVRPAGRRRRRAQGYCTWCGTAAVAEWRYCAKCGKSIQKIK